MKKDIWVISEKEKEIIKSLILKGKNEEARNKRFAVIEFDDFYKLFSAEEQAVIKKFVDIEPKKIGYNLPFIGFEPITEKLIPIDGQVYFLDNKKIKHSCQYLPESLFRKYDLLREAMMKDIGKKLMVLYGYRSPARQVFIFFDILERFFNFDFDKTLTRVCFPDYSEHVCKKQLGIDFMSDKVKGEGFEKTEEYHWLKKNANKFGFYESYPKGNKIGIMYEPWHWHYKSN